MAEGCHIVESCPAVLLLRKSWLRGVVQVTVIGMRRDVQLEEHVPGQSMFADFRSDTWITLWRIDRQYAIVEEDV